MTEEKKVEKNKYGINVEEMARAGVNFGHKKSKLHPKMEPYLFGIRNMVHIIDLEKVVKKFEEALDFIAKEVSEGKTILFVGTKIQVKDILEEVAKNTNSPFITGRWIGGTFTNFSVIKKRVTYLKKLKADKESGDWEKYTKKERLGFEKEIVDLTRKFGGIEDMNKLPDLVFITDLSCDDLALKEATKAGIPIVSITDTNTNPNLVQHPIPGNDDAVPSLKYILGKIEEVILNNAGKGIKVEKVEEKSDNKDIKKEEK
jgi:small subunit ribosomal protein S2